ncbi:unnamed protein product [Blepharisma stoltei]|uniref:Uncharacterized protein n=1 Tax=Blepharisma stoltei TaxID=1481888 RepID=A0AAU9IZN3_9CILI|nr:unnamed protein product [Blepharisma stoltei]
MKYMNSLQGTNIFKAPKSDLKHSHEFTFWLKYTVKTNFCTYFNVFIFMKTKKCGNIMFIYWKRNIIIK